MMKNKGLPKFRIQGKTYYKTGEEQVADDYIRIISSSFIGDGKISDDIYKRTLYKNKSFIIKNKNYEIITLENVIYKNGEGKIENPYEVEDI